MGGGGGGGGRMQRLILPQNALNQTGGITNYAHKTDLYFCIVHSKRNQNTGVALPEYLSFHLSMLLRLVYTNCESRDHCIEFG